MAFSAGMPKSPAFRLTPLTALIQATLLGLPAAALAGPEGGVVAAGTGTIARPDAQTTNIHQSSQNLILNWDSYNIRANETVNYRQPNANAQALNRIHSQNPSHIHGRLNANGKVLLVNPNGVFFKPGARVNVGGLMASGLNITDQDFLAGKYHFKHAGKTPPGAVVNQGVIQAATGGSVSLLGGAVRNEGRILAHAGQVNLVAGKALAMDFDGDGLMRFTVSEALLKKAGGLAQAVSNTGTIAAEGGAVLLQGRAARDVFSEVVNNSGVIGAAKVDNTGGVIRLVAAGRGNSLINTGTLQAAGGTIELKAEGKVEVSGEARISTASKTGRGGQIEITGNKVGLLGEARLDASGGAGGGRILAGGDYQGKSPAIKNAKVTYIGKDVELAADATQQGKGGRVIVWADDTTRYHGAISAKGGRAGGDGGFVEVSGKRHLAFRGRVDVSAPRGRAGTLLLDPNNLCIGGKTTCGINTPADTGTDGIFDAASSAQDSWVSEATLKDIGNADIILQADNNIYFDGNIDLGTSYTRDFRLLAGSSIDMRDHRLTLPNGTARFYAGSTVVETSGEFTTTIERSGSITLGSVTAKTLYLSAGNVNAEGTLTVTNLRLNEDRPRRTDISTGIFASSRSYTGQYTITIGGGSNAITKLYVGGTLGDKLHLITLEGYEIASPIKTGAKTTLTFELRGADHDHAKGEGAGAGDHHDDDLTITQAEGAVISGPGKLVKDGTGTLELSQANTYSGDTEVSGGALRITHADGLGTPAEKDGKTPASKTTLSVGSTLELDGHAGKLEIKASEALILNGGILRNESGDNTWHGPVTLGKASTIDSEAGALTIKSALSLQSGEESALKAENLQITGAGDVRLTGVISGKGGIIKGRAGTAGAGDTGTLTLGGNNTYTGRTIIHRGVLRIQHNNALGTGAGSLGTTVNANGTLELYATGAASLNIGNEALTLAGGTLRNARGNNTWNGNISLTAAATIDSRTRLVKFTRDGIEGEIHYQQTLTLAGNISGAHNLITFTGGGHSDMRGQIQTSTGGLTKQGAGTLTLNNSNTYTGDTTVRGGTLALGGTRTNALDPAGDLLVENNAVFALGQANQTFANVTLRSGQITRLPGAPAARGVLTVSASIQARSGAISANLAGGAPLTKTTAGRLTLSGDNRHYTGAVTVRAGILRLFGGHALDDEAEVTLSNALANNTARLEIATSQTLGSLTGRGGVFIGAGQTLTLNIGAGESASYAGVISGAAPLSRTLFRDGRLVTETIQGGLTKTGAGRLTLTGANTFGGQTRINQGKLRIEHLLALQNTAVHLADAANTQLTVATASDPKKNTRIGSLSGGAAANATGEARNNGKIVIFKGQVLAINQTTDGVYSGRITQVTPDPLPQIYRDRPRLPRPSAADFIKTGPARLTLSGKNTYTGFTLINEGTLAIGQNDAINAASSLIVGQAPRFDFTNIRLIDPVPGVFDLGRHNQTLSKVQLNAGAINRGGATGSNQGVLTVNSPRGERGLLAGFNLRSGTVNAILAGQTSLVKDNPSVEIIINRRAYKLYIESSVTLNAANTYSGRTTISKGTLRITDAGALGTAANDDATGTTIEPGGFAFFCLRGVECGTSRHGGGTLELALGDGDRIDNENLILAGRGAFDTKNLDITRATVARHIVGQFNARGALRNVSGNNTWGGAVELESNATIQNDSGDPAAAAPSLTLSGDLTLDHDEHERADLTVTGRGRTLLSGRIRGLGGLIKQGTGTLVLNRAQAEMANDYAGGTQVKAGTLELQGGYAIPDDGALNKGVTLSKNATLRMTAGETLGSLRDDPADSENPGGMVEIVKGQTLTLNNASGNDTTFSGVISEVDPASGASTASANLTKQGAGKFTLAGQNTYTGETRVEAGALRLGVTGAIHAGGRLLVSGADAVFDLAGFNNTFAGVALENGRIDDSGRGTDGDTKGALTLSTGNYDLQNGTVNAVLAGDVGLVKRTAGTVILTAANTYSGQTTINAGTLSITHEDALGDTAGGATVASGGTLALALSGTNALGETLTLAGAGAAATGGGTLGALRNMSGANTLSGNITLTGNTTIYSASGSGNSLTLRGAISGAFGLTKTGAGRLTLTGANTFSGQTRINQGELRIEHLLALQNTAVHIADAAHTQLTVATKSLPWSRERTTRIGSLSGGGKIVIFKDQVLVINQTTDGVYSGRIMEQDPVPLPEIYRRFTFLKPRPAVLIKTGAARLTLSGKNTYTGLTIINEGTLAIGQDDAIHSASSLIVGQPPRFDFTRVRLIDPVEGVFDLGTYNQTLSGVELNAGAINRTGASGPDQGVLTVKSRSGFTLTLKSGTVNAILAGKTSLVKDNPFVRVSINRRRFPIYIESAVTLNAANTYSGQTRINKGTLRITDAGALGTANNDDATGTTIERGRRRRLHTARFGFTQHGGGTLELALPDGNHSIDNENLILAGRGAFDTKNLDITRETVARHIVGQFDARGALRNVSGNNTWGGAVRLASNSTISGTGSLTFGGAIDATRAGGQDLTLDGALIARFNGTLGGTRPLRNLTINGARQIILTGALTLTGRATFRDITGVEEAGMRVAIKMREGEGSPGSLTAKALLLRGIAGRSQLRGDVDTVAANNTGALDLEDTDGLTVGTVAGVSGMTTNNAAVTLRAGGDLNMAADIRAGRGAIRLTSGGGDIYGSGAVTTSSTLTLKARGIGRANTPLNLNFTGTDAGSLRLTTSGQATAGNIYLNNQGDLKTSLLNLNTDNATAQTVQLSARRHSGLPAAGRRRPESSPRHSGAGRNPGKTTAGGAGSFLLIVDDPDAGTAGAGTRRLDTNDSLIFQTATRLDTDINTANRRLTFAGPVTANANRAVNTGTAPLTFQGKIQADGHTLTFTAARLTLTDDVTAGALDMSGAGQLIIAGNSPTLYVDPANLTFPNRMTGTGALTIPGIRGQTLDVGQDLKPPANMRGYRGHLIIGGRLTREGAMPYYSYSPDVTDIQAHVHVPRLTVSRAIATGGPVTLLGGDLDLNANIQTGGQLGLLAIGPNQEGLTGSTGLIRAGAGRVRLTVPPEGVPTGRPAAAIIAVGGFRNASNINLALNLREVDVASGQSSVGFDPGSLITDRTTDPDFRAFVSRLGRVLGTSRPLGLQLAQAFAFNPASRLTGAEALTFIDLSLFGQELTLFGAIGTGIALSLSQCEEQYGCAPNVTLEELDTLIEQLTARIEELERRLLEADEAEKATIEAQLADYRAERQNFEAYRETLKRYILAEEAADDLPGLPEAGDTDEVARLTRALQGVRARIQWLEGLRADAAERERLARATGQDLTPARLEAIIEAAKAQATFIENRIRLLLEGTEAALPQEPGFRAEAGDYEAVDVVQYGAPPGAMTLSGERGWY